MGSYNRLQIMIILHNGLQSITYKRYQNKIRSYEVHPLKIKSFNIYLKFNMSVYVIELYDFQALVLRISSFIML